MLLTSFYSYQHIKIFQWTDHFNRLVQKSRTDAHFEGLTFKEAIEIQIISLEKPALKHAWLASAMGIKIFQSCNISCGFPEEFLDGNSNQMLLYGASIMKNLKEFWFTDFSYLISELFIFKRYMKTLHPPGKNWKNLENHRTN